MASELPIHSEHAYNHEFSNIDLDATLDPWTGRTSFPYLLATFTLDGLAFILSLTLLILCLVGKRLRTTPHGWFLLNTAVAFLIFSVCDVTGIVGRHSVVTSWPQIMCLCEFLTALTFVSMFVIYLSISMLSLERQASAQLNRFPEPGISNCVARVGIAVTWTIAIGYSIYASIVTITWTTQRADGNVCISLVSKYPALVEFLLFVVCLLIISGSILAGIIWLRSDEIKDEDKAAAREHLISNIVSSCIFYAVGWPQVILALKQYDYIYGDTLLQYVAFFGLRSAGVLVPLSWLIGNPDVRAACRCGALIGEDENTYLLERMVAPPVDPKGRPKRQ